MHPSTFLLALLGTATSATRADLANDIFQPVAIVQSIITYAVPPVDHTLGRRSDESCGDAARKVLSKMSSGLRPILKPTLVSKLSSYLSDHPNITTAMGSDLCAATAGPSISGSLGSEVAEAGKSMTAFWSSITPDLQSMWSECSTIEQVSSAFVSNVGICPSVLADITGKPKGATQTQKGAAPRETGIAMAALGVAGMAIAALN